MTRRHVPPPANLSVVTLAAARAITQWVVIVPPLFDDRGRRVPHNMTVSVWLSYTKDGPPIRPGLRVRATSIGPEVQWSAALPTRDLLPIFTTLSRTVYVRCVCAGVAESVTPLMLTP